MCFDPAKGEIPCSEMSGANPNMAPPVSTMPPTMAPPTSMPPTMAPPTGEPMCFDPTRGEIPCSEMSGADPNMTPPPSSHPQGGHHDGPPPGSHDGPPGSHDGPPPGGHHDGPPIDPRSGQPFTKADEDKFQKYADECEATQGLISQGSKDELIAEGFTAIMVDDLCKNGPQDAPPAP